MSEYGSVKKGKLVLKGEKKKSKKKKKNKDKLGAGDKGNNPDELNDEQDRAAHGGWAQVDSFSRISGSVALEFGSGCYVRALDNGLFTLGAPHDEGDGPSPEEILIAIPLDDRKVAFKSGYDKYVGITKDGVVTGRSDAIGPLEQWEPVFQDGKLALSSSTNCFMSVDEDEDSIVAKSRTAGESEFLKIRCQSVKPIDSSALDTPKEEKGSLSQIELNYIKKFQKFQDKKIKVNTENKQGLKRARDEGALHEALLDRRSKMKADRYCK